MWQLSMFVFVFHKTQYTRFAILEALKVVVLWNLWMSLKKKKKIVSLFFVKAKTKEGKKAFSCEAAADLALRNKGSFFNQDEWLQEFEEHERKLNTSEK